MLLADLNATGNACHRSWLEAGRTPLCIIHLALAAISASMWPFQVLQAAVYATSRLRAADHLLFQALVAAWLLRWLLHGLFLAMPKAYVLLACRTVLKCLLSTNIAGLPFSACRPLLFQ